jgi:hypothetical protein
MNYLAPLVLAVLHRYEKKPGCNSEHDAGILFNYKQQEALNMQYLIVSQRCKYYSSYNQIQ